tara:strand:- start:1051 stop:1680 length:630 start_codon:yes stop_codon:yes gene_type:complete
LLHFKIKNAKNSLKSNSVIFLLHGYGSNEDDLFSFTPFLPKYSTIISFQAPYRLSAGSYAWYNLYPKSDGTFESDIETAWKTVDLLNKNINLIIEKYNLQSNDITLLGFSQGAILGWALAFEKLNIVRRLVALSGLIHETINTSKEPNFIAYSSHGVHDQVIPIKLARESILPISKKYNKIQYHEFPEGHTVSQENLNLFLKWLDNTKL